MPLEDSDDFRSSIAQGFAVLGLWDGLPQVPGVFRQGTTLAELEKNIREAHQWMLEEQGTAPLPVGVETKDIEVSA